MSINAQFFFILTYLHYSHIISGADGASGFKIYNFKRKKGEPEYPANILQEIENEERAESEISTNCKNCKPRKTVTRNLFSSQLAPVCLDAVFGSGRRVTLWVNEHVNSIVGHVPCRLDDELKIFFSVNYQMMPFTHHILFFSTMSAEYTYI